MDGLERLAAAQAGEAHGGPSPLEGVEPRTLAEVVETFRRWLHLPDLRALLVVLATVAASRLPGPPVWLLLVSVPSGGKTELVLSVSGLEDVHLAATLTEPALLSGSPRRERAPGASGGLLCQIGDFGIVLHKDFGSVLSMHHDARAQVLAALREVFDGSWTRHVGTDGGRALHWQGKVGLIAGVTPTIDRHAAVIASLGDRFVMFRLPRVSRREQARRAAGGRKRTDAMRRELREAVAALFAGIPDDAEPRAIDAAEVERLITIADFATAARSAVERDGLSREIVIAPEAEAPARLTQALAGLLDGLDLIGVERAAGWGIVTKAALDSLPELRRRVLLALHAADGALTTTEVELRVSHPNTSTRRALEDLVALELVEREVRGPGRAHAWRLHDGEREKLAIVLESFPEKSRGDAAVAENDARGGALSNTPTHTSDFSEKVGTDRNPASRAESKPGGGPSRKVGRAAAAAETDDEGELVDDGWPDAADAFIERAGSAFPPRAEPRACPYEHHHGREWRHPDGGDWKCAVCHPPADAAAADWLAGRPPDAT